MSDQQAFFTADSHSGDRLRRGLTALTLVLSAWLAVHATVSVTRYRYITKKEFADGGVSIFILNEVRGEVCRIDMPTNSTNQAISVVCK